MNQNPHRRAYSIQRDSATKQHINKTTLKQINDIRGTQEDKGNQRLNDYKQRLVHKNRLGNIHTGLPVKQHSMGVQVDHTPDRPTTKDRVSSTGMMDDQNTLHGEFSRHGPRFNGNMVVGHASKKVSEFD